MKNSRRRFRMQSTWWKLMGLKDSNIQRLQQRLLKIFTAVAAAAAAAVANFLLRSVKRRDKSQTKHAGAFIPENILPTNRPLMFLFAISQSRRQKTIQFQDFLLLELFFFYEKIFHSTAILLAVGLALVQLLFIFQTLNVFLIFLK